ncbi:MAG: enhanced serine sensitivity protein SseB C-terminal domain-containing protein [Bradyrhizobium sp.]
MFEPENDIERLLMRASAEPAERPAFARALMDAQIFLVMIAGGTPIGPPDADGKVIIPEGATLTLPSATRGEEKLIPFFTAPSRARTWFKGDHIIGPDRTRDFFARYPGAPFVLNPGSDYGKDFTPGEVARMLAGEFDMKSPQAITTEAPQQILLAHPKEMPAELIAALAREFASVKSVRGAWLMLAMRGGEQSWMLGVDHQGPWQDVRDAIGRAIVGDILGGRMLDAMPLEGSSFAATLRTGIPVTAAKPGFLH